MRLTCSAALALLLGAAPAHAVGTVLERAPSVAPGGMADTDTEPLVLARQRWREGDAAGTITALTPWLESRRSPYGRERTAGHLLLGMAHMQQENWNLASTHFYLVRRTDDPLAAWGAWNEAVVDHNRGRHQVAINECVGYRERFPEGLHADECLVLMGEAHAALGRAGAAIGSFQAWLDLHPDSPRSEEISLAKARAVAGVDPSRGIPMLQDLVLTHTFPSTAVGARQALDQLAADGHDIALPTDRTSRMRMAESLRRSGKLVEAWDMFSTLQEEGETLGPDGQPLDPTLRAWADDNEERFAWGTRQFDVFAEKLRPAYDASPGSRMGWRIFRAYTRGGMWQEASDWGAAMLDAWGGGDYRTKVAWAFMHAGRFAEARTRFADLRGGDARFYAAFCGLRDGQLAEATAELIEIAESRSSWAGAAAWWASRGLAAQGKWTESRSWERRGIELDDTGWYRLLSEDRRWRAAGALSPPVPPGGTTATDSWVIRDGAWQGHQPAQLPAQLAQAAPAAEAWTAGGPDARPDRSLARVDGSSGWASLRWESDRGLRVASPAAASAAPSTEDATASLTITTPSPTGAPVLDPATPRLGSLSPAIALPIGEEALPGAYEACTWFDPVAAEQTFARISSGHADLLPDLPAAFDLARAGQAVDSGRILRDAWDQWDRAAGKGDPDSLRLRRIRIGDWRDMAIYAQQPHLTYRLCLGLYKYADNADDELAAWKLAYPLVRAPELWRHGRTYGVDPFLVLGIMRQESTYQPTVVSHAGAIGLVQVMPRTGAKVAALLGEGRYSPRDLEDPSTNLRYGSYYLSLLLDRFGGAFPLAVASYNGGPHNVSRWLSTWRDTPEQLDLAAFVEQIEYGETRDYVKKVSGYYDTYVRLYGPRGARVVVPENPTKDDPTVVDF